MLKNPDDRRARRTRRLLKESLLELMRHQRFSDISIRDVTEHADMNRTTFYLHYTDTAQLLQSVEADLMEQAQALVDRHLQEAVTGGTVRPIFEPVLDFVVEHREVCTTLIENNEASHFTEHLQKLFLQNGETILRAWFRAEDEQQSTYLLSFITYGLIGLITEWFHSSMDMSKEDVLLTAEKLVDGAAAGLLGRSQPPSSPAEP